ncbi:MAG: alpha/beta fold hydrolase [Solirubrobacteraceae bacterium]|jgi:pimeloyl-ACP methyl ester carboxylesterase
MTELVPDLLADRPLAARGRPFYLATEPDPVFVMAHIPRERERSATGVILCSPFGWDELSSHRSLRSWAGALAEAGHPTLRFDLPGCGDSAGSPRDPERLEAWTAALEGVAASLRANQGCERIVAIGIGLGGIVAARALALGAPIDDLVLWGVYSRGHVFMRELQAFARILDAEAVHIGAVKETPPAPADSEVLGEGAVNASGFLMTAETVAAIEALKLTELPVPNADRRRILFLRRDSSEVDQRLREHYERSGAEVTVADGAGYGAMMVDPQFSKTPWETFAYTTRWLADAVAGADAFPPFAAAPARAAELELTVAEVAIRETPFEFEFAGELLSGVLTEPVASSVEVALCAILLNPGAVRRIGHHRMWVEVARRWAARGVSTLRLDVLGVGDSDGAEDLYAARTSFQRHELAKQVIAACDELERRGLPGRFIVGGLCSGGYWGLHAALADERVRGLLLVNLLAFYWSDDFGAMRDARRTRALLRERDLGTIARIVAADRWRLARMVRVTARRMRFGRGGSPTTTSDADIVEALDRLREGDVESLLLLSLGEPLYDDFVAYGLLERLDEWPNLHLERIPTAEHVFRSAWSQVYIHEALDAALARTLGREGRRSGPG